MIDAIETVVVLNTTQKAAFDAFVAQIDTWWPVSRFSICGGTVAIDPQLGGKITETGADGALHVWGHVTAWEAGQHLEISWYVGEAVVPTAISVRFAPTDDGRTGVTLIHAGWEALAEGAAEKRANYAQGWTIIFETAYADFAATTCPVFEDLA